MKQYVFHLVGKRADAPPPAQTPTLLPLVEASGKKSLIVPRNNLTLIYELPSTNSSAEIAAIFEAKSRGWNGPIDQLSFFLNRIDDVFSVDWRERRLLTRSTFDALRGRGKITVPLVDSPRLDDVSGDSIKNASKLEEFEYLAIGALADFLAVDERAYFGARTLVVG